MLIRVLISPWVCDDSFHAPTLQSEQMYVDLSGRRKFLKLAVQFSCFSGSMLIELRAHSHSSSRSNDWDV